MDCGPDSEHPAVLVPSGGPEVYTREVAEAGRERGMHVRPMGVLIVQRLAPSYNQATMLINGSVTGW